MKYVSPFVVLIMLLFSCNTAKKFTPKKLYPRHELEADYRLVKNILEAKHPSLYWYTSKDSMDFYFQNYYNRIKDSMTEQDFQWHVLSPLINKIHCGHTAVMMSKASEYWHKNRKTPSFPFHLKIWNDTMAITENLLKKDSVFKRGTIIKSINGIQSNELIKIMLGYLSEDGYAHNVNYIRISSNFPVVHKYIFGLSKEYTVTYIDSSGNLARSMVPLFKPTKDSADTSKTISRKSTPSKKFKKVDEYRTFTIDSTRKFAVMRLNSFSKGRLRTFFRKSFRTIRQENIPNLILDIRINGGGNVSTSTLLTKYISKSPFKVADTVYSKTKTLYPHAKYFKWKFLNNIELCFVAHKKSSQQFHLTRYEKKIYQPKRSNHFEGKAYVLINGPTFSASCLFANAIKGQQNIKLVGEETGGGWYGNNGIMIPDVRLPNSRLRVRMPLFRLVQYNHVDDNKGKGIAPDIYIPTSYDALLKSYDKKMQVVKEMIINDSKIE